MSLTDMDFEEKEGGVSFLVMLTTRASRPMINGIQRDFLRIKLSSPPIDNKANAECIEFLSRVFSTAKSKITITQGHRSRRKRIHINGISAERAQQILDEHIV